MTKIAASDPARAPAIGLGKNSHIDEPDLIIGAALVEGERLRIVDLPLALPRPEGVQSEQVSIGAVPREPRDAMVQPIGDQRTSLVEGDARRRDELSGEETSLAEGGRRAVGSKADHSRVPGVRDPDASVGRTRGGLGSEQSSDRPRGSHARRVRRASGSMTAVQ